MADVYEDTYEQIMRKLRIDDAIGELVALNTVIGYNCLLTAPATDEFWEPGSDLPSQSLLHAIPELARAADTVEV